MALFAPEWGMTMVGRPRDFRHHDVVRAFKAARAAGIDNPSLQIKTPTGTEYHIGGEVKGAPETRGRAARASVGKGNQNRAPLAEGGKASMFAKQAADTAPPGRTAKIKRAAAPNEASGGMAWPAKPA